MSYTCFNAPLLGSLLGDAEIQSLFSVEADIAAMVRFECALANAEAACGVIPPEAADAIRLAAESFSPDISELGEAAARDGLVVPAFVRQLRAHVGDPHGCHVHFGATSQDVIDTSLILRLRDAAHVLLPRLAQLEKSLSTLERQFGERSLMAKTRMQSAVPVTVADRLRLWKEPVHQHQERLATLLPKVVRLQFGGAAGTLEKLGDDAEQVAHQLGDALDLPPSDGCWHTDRSGIADLAHWLSLVTGSLGKIGQDIALMAQNEVRTIAVRGTGGSSTMAHKQNPVKAEVLVALARFNAVLVSAIHQSMVHEQERSGAAWTLEWMTLPQMVIATGAATRTAVTLIHDIEAVGADALRG
ncbi:MAG: 3-carboxy-cis,cis-muconate cycloisomerase [Pseudomonadota bacterium]